MCPSGQQTQRQGEQQPTDYWHGNENIKWHVSLFIHGKNYTALQGEAQVPGQSSQSAIWLMSHPQS